MCAQTSKKTNESIRQSGADTGIESVWKWIAVPAAYLMVILMLKWPETAANAAGSAMRQWYNCVVPALFPFMMLLPLITGREASYIYEKLLGRAMGAIFELPGCAAPAIMTAMVAGSPAGVIAAARIAEQMGLGRGQLLRMSGCLSGLSPAFLISGIGAGIMGDTETGVMLFKTQMCVQLVMLALSRKHMKGENIRTEGTWGSAPSTAVMSVLSVAGYMVFFRMIGGLLGRISHNGIWDYLICILEATAGAEQIAASGLARELKLVALSAMCGFGGVSIFAQNMKILLKYGITALEYLKWRICAAVLSALLMALQICIGVSKLHIIRENWLETATFIAIILIIPMINAMKKQFLNKKNFQPIGD